MISRPIAAIAATALVVLIPALASAQTTASINHVYAGKSSIKITGVSGASVSVKGYRGTLPAIISYNNNPHTFIDVLVTRSGQTIWREKVEVKPRMQTVVTLNYRGAATKRPKAVSRPMPTRRFIGTLYNTTNHCKNAARGDVKLQFMRGGQTVKSFEVGQGMRLNNVELPTGTYDVRVYQKRSGSFMFTKTFTSNVDKDGWVFSYGCQAPKTPPTPKAPAARFISNTSYRLVSGTTRGKCLVAFNSGKQVLPGLAACSSHKAQRWMWTNQLGSPIQNAATGQCLTLLSNGNLDMRACDGSNSQKWNRAQSMPGWWQWSPALSRGKCLSATRRTTNGFINMGLSTCGAYSTDNWKASN